MTDDYVRDTNIGDQTDIDDDIVSNDKLKEIDRSSLPFPTVMHIIESKYISQYNYEYST